MSRAREFADLAGSADAGGLTGRNLIINGAMQVFQRATAATAAAGGYETADRFIMGETSGGAYTTERSTDHPTSSGYSLKAQVTTADTSISAAHYAYIFHKIEAQNLQHLAYGTSSAKTLTLSFFVKSNKTGTYTVNLYKPDGTGYIFVQEYTIDSADTWEKKTITISPTAGSTSFITASAGAIANDNGSGLEVGFGLAWGSNYTGGTSGSWSSNTNHYATTNQVNWLDSTSNNFYLTQIQLEVGEKATPFEHEPFTSQWHKCQRYCTVYNIGGGDVHPENYILPHHSPPGKPGHVDVNNRGEWQLEWPVKRAAPTLTFTDLTNMRWGVGNNGVLNGTSAGAMSVGTSPEGGTVFQNVASGMTHGASDVTHIISMWIKQSSGNNPKIVIDAEL